MVNETSESVNTAGEDSPNYAGKGWCLLRPLHRFRAAKVVTVEPVVFLIMLSRFLYVTLYEQYFYWRFGEVELQGTTYTFSNSSFCLNSSELDLYVGNGTYKVVETNSNHLVIYGAIARRVPSVIATLIAGPLSDRFGRRPIMMLSAFGFFLQGVIAMVIVHFHLNVYLFIAASVVCGIGGEMGTLLTTCFAYVADVGSKKWRSFRLGMVEGFLFIGGALGQGILGFWLNRNNCDFMPPLYCYAACNAVAMAYILFILPESLPHKKRQELSKKGASGFLVIVQGVKIFFCGMKQYSVWRLWAALLSVGIVLFNVVGFEYIVVYFLKAPPFDWDAVKVGLAMALHILSRGLSLLLVLPVMVALKFPDGLISLIGLTANFLANVLTGFSKKTYQIFASELHTYVHWCINEDHCLHIVAGLQGMEAVIMTAARAIMSKIVAPEHQGMILATV